MRDLILGVDPGNTTGIALCQRNVPNLLAAHQSLPAFEGVQWLWAVLEQDAARLEVAIEKFTIGPQTLSKTRQPDALHVTGAVRFKCEQLQVPWTLYKPADTMHFVDDDFLKLRDLFVGTVHTRDAIRQAVMHLATKHPEEYKKLYDASR